jgi:hypothetical protein
MRTLVNKKIVFFLIIFVICCSFKESKHCQLSDKIFFSYNKELLKNKHLFLIGSGGGMMDDIKKVNAYYVSFEKMNIEEARRLYVEVAEGYMSRYNENEQIRPYLHNYPLTIGNFKISIGFEDETRKYRDQGLVAVVFNGKNNRIVYCTYDHEKEKFVDLLKEPYETAQAIVLSEKRRSQ